VERGGIGAGGYPVALMGDTHRSAPIKSDSYGSSAPDECMSLGRLKIAGLIERISMNDFGKTSSEPTSADIVVRLDEAVKAFRRELGEPVMDIIDAGIGSLLIDEFLSNLPWVKFLLGLMKFGVSVDNLLFIKKAEHFLFEFDEPEEKEEREQFFSRLKEDEHFRQRVEDNLILMLHRLDDMEKPVLLARAFRAHYVTHKIDHPTFQRLRTAIERIKPHNIQDLLDYYNKPFAPSLPSNESLQDLAYCGLVSFVSGVWFQANDGSSRDFDRNEYGRLFIEIALEQELSSAAQANAA
jgi:hypothetical protein